MTPRGFPNIALVRDAMGALLPAIKRGALPPPPADTWSTASSASRQAPVIRVQHLARRIADVYALDVGLIVVAFRGDIDVAGRVEIGGAQQRDFFIELRDDYAQHDVAVAAILGHEVAHIFLHRHRMHPPPGLYAEVMTDIAAALYGFGPVMAEMYRVEERRHAEHHMGYLTPDELGFVLFRSGFNFTFCMLAVSSDAARAALRIGRAQAERELTAPPLRCAAWWKRLQYRAQRWWSELARRKQELEASRLYALAAGHVYFRCVLCCQGLRVPTRKEMTAVCPRCETAMACST